MSLGGSPLLDGHRSAGARLVDRPEAPGHATVLTFGDVPSEYRAARSSSVLLDECDRGRVALLGADTLDFLHRLLANHVKALSAGSANRNLLLSSKGKVLFDFELLRRADSVELSTPPGRAAPLAEALERYHFSEDVRIEETSAGHAPLVLLGPAAPEVLARALDVSPAPEPREVRALSWHGSPVDLWALDAGEFRIDGGPELAARLWKALCDAGATPGGLAVRDMRRVEAGRGLFGLDIDENVYPQEAGIEAAFALDKGCYIGQEVVAKIDTYGGLNKRLLPLRIDHSDPVPRGTTLLRDEEGERRELGLVTSWAYSFQLETGLVLAYVKRRHQEPGTEFELAAGHGKAVIVPAPG